MVAGLSVVIAALALAYTWSKDRLLRRREQADRVRSAAAQALAKLERWAEFDTSLGSNVQDLLVDISLLLVAEFDRERARDQLWKGLNAARRDISTRQRNEDLETAYVALYGHRPDAYGMFTDALRKLKEASSAAFCKLLENSQSVVLAHQSAASGYQPAVLGNELRLAVEQYEVDLAAKLGAVLNPVRRSLGLLIEASDKLILKRGWSP